MRKMKKFLAVALSAAMVLSVSVPAMAAGETTQTESTSDAQKRVEEAKKAEEAAQKAVDAAKADIDAAKKALDAATSDASSLSKVTDEQVNALAKEAANLYACGDKDNSNPSEEQKKNGVEALTKAVEALEPQKTADEQAVKDAELNVKVAEAGVTLAKNNLADAQAALAEDPDNEEKKQAVVDANKALADANKDKTDADAALTKAQGDAATSKAAYDGAKAKLTALENKILAKESERQTAAYKRDAYKAGTGAVDKAKATLKEKEDALLEAEKNLDAAQKERRAAEAAVNEVGKRISKAEYDKAVIAEQIAAEEEAKAQADVEIAKAKVQDIQKQIDAQLAYFTAYDEALNAYTQAQKTKKEAAVALAKAEADFAVKEAAYEAAKNGTAITAEQTIEKAKRKYQDALQNPNYQTGTSIEAFVNAAKAVEDAKKAFDTALDNYSPDNVAIVLENAEFYYNEAKDNAEAAATAWRIAEGDVLQKKDAFDKALENYNKAIQALYGATTTTDVNGALCPKNAKGTTLVRDSENGRFVEAEAGSNPAKAADPAKAGTPAEYRNYESKPVVRYPFTTPKQDGTTVLTAETDYRLKNNAVSEKTRKDGTVYAEVEAFASATAVAIDDYISATKNPTTSLYGKKAFAEGVVEARTAVLTAKAKVHDQKEKELAEAEAKFEYYNSYKPGEETPDEKEAREAEEAAEAEVIAKFTDVVADWYTPYVAHVYKKGIMTGYADGKTFGTYDTLQRQDVVVTLWRMAGTPKVNYAINYKDVDPNAYYADALRWAASTGVARGYNAEEFGVGKNITREDFTVMLHRNSGYPTEVAEISNFKDASKVSGYAEKAIKWAVATGAITGKNEGTTIDPQAPIVRCEAAKILDIVSDWTI
jgi:hypothetical protein